MKEFGQIWGWVKILAVSCLLSVGLFFLCAWLLYQMKGGTEMAEKMVLGIYLISCLAGGFFNGKRVKQKRLLCGLITGGLYFLLLLLIIWVYGNSGVPLLSDMGFPLAACLIGGILGSLIS
jgi:putative membrane protein (TIGR04086 family)